MNTFNDFSRTSSHNWNPISHTSLIVLSFYIRYLSILVCYGLTRFPINTYRWIITMVLVSCMSIAISSKARPSVLISQFFCLLVMWPWISYLVTLYLGFIICKMGLITVSCFQVIISIINTNISSIWKPHLPPQPSPMTSGGSKIQR